MWGKTVLPAGRRLLPAELGLLASLGVGEVSVRRRLRVAEKEQAQLGRERAHVEADEPGAPRRRASLWPPC